jgi:hypothetical protein
VNVSIWASPLLLSSGLPSVTIQLHLEALTGQSLASEYLRETSNQKPAARDQSPAISNQFLH